MNNPDMYGATRGDIIISQWADGTLTHAYHPADAQYFVVTRETMDQLLAGHIVTKGPTPHAANNPPRQVEEVFRGT